MSKIHGKEYICIFILLMSFKQVGLNLESHNWVLSKRFSDVNYFILFHRPNLLPIHFSMKGSFMLVHNFSFSYSFTNDGLTWTKNRNKCFSPVVSFPECNMF